MHFKIKDALVHFSYNEKNIFIILDRVFVPDREINYRVIMLESSGGRIRGLSNRSVFDRFYVMIFISFF